MTVGHQLKVLVGKVTKNRNDGSTKEANEWENLGLFASRKLAQKAAEKRRPGKKIHISRVRFDSTPVESSRRPEGSSKE